MVNLHRPFYEQDPLEKLFYQCTSILAIQKENRDRKYDEGRLTHFTSQPDLEIRYAK